MTAVHYDDDRESRQVVGPLVTWWVEGLEYWQTVVAGECAVPGTIRRAGDDERLAPDDRAGAATLGRVEDRKPRAEADQDRR